MSPQQSTNRRNCRPSRRQAEAQATINDFSNAFASVARAAILPITVAPTANATTPPTTNHTPIALTTVAPITAIAPTPPTTNPTAIAFTTLAPTAIALFKPSCHH
jgi:hypothetical protein